MQTSTFPSVRALDQLLGGLGAGAARRRQLDMVRGELERALSSGALPVPARRSLRRLLEEEALRPYVRLAESGALRHRRVAGGFPPTSKATNEIRRTCIDLLRAALEMPALHLGGGEIPLQPAPEAATLSVLARQLDRYLGGAMSPAQTRLTTLLALELDTAARSGELADLRTTDLGEDNVAVYAERRPQGGGAIEGEWVETSALTRAALERWLPVRKDLVQRAHGTSRLWVALDEPRRCPRRRRTDGDPAARDASGGERAGDLVPGRPAAVRRAAPAAAPQAGAAAARGGRRTPAHRRVVASSCRCLTWSFAVRRPSHEGLVISRSEALAVL
ncbi:hypothetical protein ACFU8Q_36890 [Streptomyces sp. NPDC057543]|uniref:hypothetical protein n=1 Tax=Streptomyces sp. NPDC057543 TaxID=3346163 RepID=UPI0036A4C79E